VRTVTRRGPVSVLLVLAAVLAFGVTPTSGQTATVRVLVVKATWGPQPQANVRNLTDPTAAFFTRASFGSVQLSFTETPWLHAYADRSSCGDVRLLLEQGEAAAAQFSPAAYDRVMYVTPCRFVDVGSVVVHAGTVGLPASPALFEHELGHTFGMSHAGALDCSSTCVLNPYGNVIDVMGSGVGDFGTLQKAEAGWPVVVRDATVPGTYRLAALELPGTLPQALVVHRGAVDLWIEHRAAVGNDAFLKSSPWRKVAAAVLVHETPANPLGIPFLERRPDFLLGNGGPRHFWLMRGKTFTVPHVVRIDVVGLAGTTVTVRLSVPRQVSAAASTSGA
jgi:hypothetical protein